MRFRFLVAFLIVVGLAVLALVLLSVPPEEPPPSPAAPETTAPAPAGAPPPGPSPAVAGQPALGLPIVCTPQVDCWIANYVDIDPEPGVRDYACGRLAYDGHKGTDFAIRDMAAMREGVPVIAAAPGRVLGIRDSMPDVDVSRAGAQSVAGQECGNGVGIDIGNGWFTQYCHMRQGSVRVKPGDTVATGDVLGLVGLSGLTEFPHVHLQVTRDKAVVDPFAGVDRCAYCGLGPHPLWRADLLDDLAYRPAKIYNIGITDRAPEYEDIRDGQGRPERLDTAADALVLWVDIFGVEVGDDLHLVITGPGGRVVHDSRATIDRSQARRFQFSGLKRQGATWPAGTYRGTAILTRNEDKLGPGTYSAETTVEIR